MLDPDPRPVTPSQWVEGWPDWRGTWATLAEDGASGDPGVRTEATFH